MTDESRGGTVADLFAMAISAERAAQQLYQAFAEKYAHLPEVAALWQEMMRDEEVHAENLERIRQTLTPQQLGAPADPTVLWKAREGAYFAVQDSLASVKTLEDAYHLAHDLEYSEVNTVFQFIMMEYIAYGDKRDFVVAQLQEHVGRLDAFGASQWRDSDTWRS